jgi:hypothetical protein
LHAEVPILNVGHVVVDVVIERNALAIRLRGTLVRKHAVEVRIRVVNIPLNVFREANRDVRRIQVDRAVEAEGPAETETVGDRRRVIHAIPAAKHNLLIHGVGKADLRSKLSVVRIARTAFPEVIHEHQRAGPIPRRRVGFGEIDHGHAAGDFVEPADHFPAEADVQRQFAIHLPIILDVEPVIAPPVAEAVR